MAHESGEILGTVSAVAQEGGVYVRSMAVLFSAIRLYESLGFRRTGEPPDDLHGTPLVTLAKRLER